jgi:cellulose biosynthesis protein BcsQ
MLCKLPITASCSSQLTFGITTGGLGKSTLANQVYTEMQKLELFNDGSSRYLAFDLDSDSNDSAVIGELQRWLESQIDPVLLLLDNAQRQYQLDCVLKHPNIIDKSFVLITSRRRDLVAPSDLYDMPTMRDNDALELFQWHSQGPDTAGAIKTRALKVRIS